MRLPCKFRHALLIVLSLSASTGVHAAWPLIWDYAGRSDRAIAAQIGVNGDLWLLSDSYAQGAASGHAVLLRITPQGAITWTADDAELTAPVAMALRPDGSALVLGAAQSNLHVSAFDPTGKRAWSRTRSGIGGSQSFFGPDASPIWDATLNAWRIPASIGGDFAVISFASNGDALPDRIWSPPEGNGSANSVLPRADGGMLIAGVVDVSPPGWWIVALDAAGSELWKRFDIGNAKAGAFSGAFLLSADPVRAWVDDETGFGVFSVYLWSLDAATGAPLWSAVWPPSDEAHFHESFRPNAVKLAGNRIVASGLTDAIDAPASFNAAALSFDAHSGALQWARHYPSIMSALRADIAVDEGTVLLAGTLFPSPNPGPTPLWLSAWYRDGSPCAPPQSLLPARTIEALQTQDGGWLAVGYRFSAGATADDVIVQRVDDPCVSTFGDGFEQSPTSGQRAGLR